MAHEFDPEGPSPVPPLTGGAIDYDPKAAPAPPPRPAVPSHSSTTPIIMSVVLAAAGVGAYFAGKSMEGPAAPAAPATAEGKADPAAPAVDAAKPAEPAPAPTPAAVDVAPLKEEVAALTKQVAELAAKVEAAPKAEAADVKPLEAKVAELAKVPDMVAPLPKRIDDLDGRLAGIGTTLDGLKAEVAALKAAPAPAPAPAAAADPKPEDVNVADQAMGQAVDLFKQGKYKDAAAAFVKLSEADANDARVWYYAAISNGLGSGKWDGDTATYVNKGIALEKAGSPATDKIDPVFADLTTKTGKDWLAGYRKRAK